MILLNFSHPLTPEQISQIQTLTGQPVERVLALPVQFDNAQPYLPQLVELMAGIPLSTDDWQTLPMLVNLPSLNVIAALLLAELHGRMGYFPAVLRLRPVEGSLPPRFELAEVLNLQEVRSRARQSREG